MFGQVGSDLPVLVEDAIERRRPPEPEGHLLGILMNDDFLLISHRPVFEKVKLKGCVLSSMSRYRPGLKGSGRGRVVSQVCVCVCVRVCVFTGFGSLKKKPVCRLPPTRKSPTPQI